MVAEPGNGSRSSRDPLPADWTSVEPESDSEEALRVALKWGRLLRKYFGFRKLQLYYHTIGCHLQSGQGAILESARKRLSKLYPIEKKGR